MAFLRFIFCFLFGDHGPADIDVTRGEGAATFRLPNRWHAVSTTRPWLIAALVVGSVLIYTIIRNTLALPRHRADLQGMAVGVAIVAALMGVVIYKWRVAWHWDIRLTAATVQARYVSTFFAMTRHAVDLGPIEQFTVLRYQDDYLLQAEFKDAAPRILVRDGDGELLVRLATRLADECARLSPERPIKRVSVESALQGVQPDRVEPPLQTDIVMTRSETGLTLDFPLRPDERLDGRVYAWRLFEVGIACMLGAVLWYAVCSFGELPRAGDWAIYGLIGGIIALILSANQSWTAFRDTTFDDDLRQLAVLGDMLVRTTRDHRKQVWYRKEIDVIALEDNVESEVHHSEGGGDTVVAVKYYLRLLVRLKGGDKKPLTLWSADYPLADYRPKAELEWVATLLREALGAEPLADEAAVSHAIQDRVGRPQETRIVASPEDVG